MEALPTRGASSVTGGMLEYKYLIEISFNEAVLITGHLSGLFHGGVSRFPSPHGLIPDLVASHSEAGSQGFLSALSCSTYLHH